jgi:hypothetical protein
MAIAEIITNPNPARRARTKPNRDRNPPPATSQDHNDLRPLTKNHFAAPTRCFSFVTVNAEGTAFVPLGDACDGAKG